MQLGGDKRVRSRTRAPGRGRSAAAPRREREFLLRNFAAVLAHEMSAPLAALRQTLDAMGEGDRDRLAKVRSRVDGLLGTVRAWLKAAVTDPESAREGFLPVPVARLLARVVEVLGPLASRKGVGLDAAGAERAGSVPGDEDLLVSALVNIVGNAVKYSPPGEKVRIRVSRGRGRVEISVIDAGTGIGRGARGTSGEEGHGLGLEIGRRVLEAHGGTVSSESEPGRGSAFVLSLPAWKDRANEPAGKAGGYRKEA
jgi:signal transduction histidine kinase